MKGPNTDSLMFGDRRRPYKPLHILHPTPKEAVNKSDAI